MHKPSILKQNNRLKDGSPNGFKALMWMKMKITMMMMKLAYNQHQI